MSVLLFRCVAAPLRESFSFIWGYCCVPNYEVCEAIRSSVFYTHLGRASHTSCISTCVIANSAATSFVLSISSRPKNDHSNSSCQTRSIRVSVRGSSIFDSGYSIVEPDDSRLRSLAIRIQHNVRAKHTGASLQA